MLQTMTEEFRAEREVRFQVVDRIRSRLPDLPPEEITLDVAQAIAAARADVADEAPNA